MANVTQGAVRNNNPQRKHGRAVETCGLERRESRLAIRQKIQLIPLEFADFGPFCANLGNNFATVERF